MSSGGVIQALAEAAGRDVPRETLARIECYVALIKAAASEQSLIAPSTINSIWERHILDSAQLVRHEPTARASWIDIGSGAGLPGVVVALLGEGPVTLTEPRRLRAEFLQHVIHELRLSPRVTVLQTKVERVTGTFDMITARAVASLPRLLELSAHLSTKKTVWALPKGRSALAELAEAQRAWQGVFHVEQSVTDDDSFIIVASGVGKKP